MDSAMARRVTLPVVEKRPFAIRREIPRIRWAVKAFPNAATFQLAEEGYASVFEQLVACII